MRPISVIIPVYNAFAETAGCLASVLKHTSPAVRVLLIDDASSEGDLRSSLQRDRHDDSRFFVVRNESNLGFVGSCNRGMRDLSADDDVILLNSDTEVTPRWVEKLQQAAYSRPTVGTVTPLTNNGSICSFPRFCCDNELPKGFLLDELANIVEQVSLREYPCLPTAVGHCMYIKREVLKRVGLFDEKAFGKGYGEENDFSCRAQRLGFIDVLDDATFILHKRNCSFKGERAELARRNEETLRQRYPRYYPAVAEFCRKKPLRIIHNRILDAMTLCATSQSKATVLHILHNGPYLEHWHSIGGTELHVQDLIDGAHDIFHWTLVPSRTGFVLSAHFGAFEREIEIPEGSLSLAQIIERRFFDLVHVHHTRGFDRPVLTEVLKRHGRYVVSVHDYHWVCPRIFMVTPQLKHCTGKECVSVCSYSDERISSERNLSVSLLEGAACVIGFSQSTKRYIEGLLSAKINWRILPHGISGQVKRAAPLTIDAPSKENALRLVFVGHLPDHKGGRIVREVVEREYVLTNDGVRIPLDWHLVGQLYDTAPGNLHLHGTYPRGKLDTILEEVRPHLAILPSICPETYSVTLDELWNSGLPVVCGPLGAPAERVSDRGAGWVLGEMSAAAIETQLAGIVSNWDDYVARRQRVAQVTLRSASSEARECAELYQNLCSTTAVDSVLLLHLLRECIDRVPFSTNATSLSRILGWAWGKAESLGLRPVLKDFVHRLFSPSTIEKIKKLKR